MKHFSQYITEEPDLTLQYHDTLNTKLWRGTNLKSVVRKKLLHIGTTWAAWAHIPTDAILDIILVGGNANFNYTDHSDVDIHIIVNKKKLPNCPELVDDYFKDKKELWSLTHKIKIYGHDVELYAQDKDAKLPKDQGAYSIQNDKWINQPKHHDVNMDNAHIHKKVIEFNKKINTLIATNASDQSFKQLKDKVKNMRASGLQKAGEFAFENLVFKELRNTGVLDKMNEYIRLRKDEELSL